VPRGRRTNLAQAVLARVLAEMGFEPWEIASLTGLPRRTVKDISHGKGAWSPSMARKRASGYHLAEGYRHD
jgi:hypothetical protein